MFGIGVDIVPVGRVEAMLSRYGERFKRKIFTEGELRRLKKAEDFAGIIAAKEAIYKALGEGQRSKIRFKEIEILRGRRGRPYVKLHGLMKESFKGGSQILVSISHDAGLAIAVAILV